MKSYFIGNPRVERRRNRSQVRGILIVSRHVFVVSLPFEVSKSIHILNPPHNIFANIIALTKLLYLRKEHLWEFPVFKISPFLDRYELLEGEINDDE